MNDFWKLSALELRALIRRKEVKPSEIMEVVLGRMEKVNPEINAFCTPVPDAAMEEARRADDQMLSGKKQGPLFGVPVSIKDLIFTRGIRTTFGSKMHEHFIPDRDEVVVERLKAAGAIVLGKTATCEFGYKSVTDSPLWGVTRNPWDPSRTPAGSSGGAGAAVASGLGPLAVGSDGGGSIRAPASFCGIFGLKPTRGRVPMYPLLPGWEALDQRVSHLGPMTRTVSDAALMMEVMAGYDPRDPISFPGENPPFQKDLTKGIKGFKIAWSPALGETRVEPQVKAAVGSAARVFSELGGAVEEAKPDLPPMHSAFQLLFGADCAGAIGARLEEWRGRLDRGLVRLTEIGLKGTAADYVRAVNLCQELRNRIQSFFNSYDLLLTPTLPVLPFPVGIDWPREVAGSKVHPLNYLGFTYPFNVTGQPAASVPCAWTEEKLPVGLQIVGRRFDDLSVLRAAAVFEEARPWREKWPEVKAEG